MLSIFRGGCSCDYAWFSIPFTAASLCGLSVFKRLNDAVANLATAAIIHRVQLELPGHIAQVLTANLGAFFYGAIAVALFTLGFLVATTHLH